MTYVHTSIEMWLDSIFEDYYSNFYFEKNTYRISIIHKRNQESIEYEIPKITTNQSNEILEYVQDFIKNRNPEYFL